jgi:hypothetical protein
MSCRLEVETVEPDTKTDVSPVVDCIVAWAQISTSSLTLLPGREVVPPQLGVAAGATKQIPTASVFELRPSRFPREATTLQTALAVAGLGPPVQLGEGVTWSREITREADSTPFSID